MIKYSSENGVNFNHSTYNAQQIHMPEETIICIDSQNYKVSFRSRDHLKIFMCIYLYFNLDQYN